MKHFTLEELTKTKIVETQDKIEQSRLNLQNGVDIAINKIQTLCHLVDSSLINIEKVETDESINNKTKYQLNIQYINVIKGLIESLAKLTGELKQEGTIDINFFTTEISVFVDIVLAAMRDADRALGLEGKMEQQFAIEFQNRWKAYKSQQNAILNGDAKPRQQNLSNDFNEGR